MKRNLVLGGEGFIGKPLCAYLRGLGEEVTSLDIKDGCDLRSYPMNCSTYDAVYFLAWDVGGAKWLGGDSAQLDQCENNTQIMTNVFDCLRDLQTQFVFVSSRLAEKDTVYGVQKRLGELWTDQLPNGRYVRLYNVYGAYEECTERSHVVADFIHQAIDTGKIDMIGDGSEMRDFVHIDEVCVHLALAASGATVERDCCSGEELSIRNVADIILDIVGGDVCEDGCDWCRTVELFKQRKGMA